jgi:hypothetical protein
MVLSAKKFDRKGAVGTEAGKLVRLRAANRKGSRVRVWYRYRVCCQQYIEE